MHDLHDRDPRQCPSEIFIRTLNQLIDKLDGIGTAAALLNDDAEAAISAICSSEITPGPLGMAETRPSAAAPWSMAILASSAFEIQQILTRGRLLAHMLRLCDFRSGRSQPTSD